MQGSGKTTLAEFISQQDSRYVFYPEIGRKVREEVDYNTLQSGDAFDREVMRREFERDNLIIDEVKIPLIETWHTGNIGYVAARSPQLLNTYVSALINQLKRFDPTCFFIHIDWETFRQRNSRRTDVVEMDQLMDFYKLVSEKTLGLYEAFGIRHFIIENQAPIQEGVAHLTEYLELNEGIEHKKNKEIY